MIDAGANGSRPPEDPDGVIPLHDIPLHSTNLLSLLDRDGVIRYQSPSIERLLGFTEEELVGVPCTECFHPDDRDRVYAAFENVVSNRAFVVEAVEYRHLQGDGTFRWVESVASSNPTTDGYYVINTRDISERRRRRLDLERANARLQEFADVVSHDLRNPLAVARGYVDLAAEDIAADHYVKIVTALDRMESLIESLLSNARAGVGETDLEPVDLSRLSRACWRTVVTKDATLHVDIDRSVLADEAQLAQVLENAFRNAVDHGTDAVTVTVGSLETGFYVEDDGPGIPKRKRERIFKPGYTTTPRGTGLGLAIVRRVVESHGWDVRATESAGGGVRLEFTGVESAD